MPIASVRDRDRALALRTRMPAELLREVEHPLPGLVADPRLAVERVRHGGLGQLQPVGEPGDGHSVHVLHSFRATRGPSGRPRGRRGRGRSCRRGSGSTLPDYVLHPRRHVASGMRATRAEHPLDGRILRPAAESGMVRRRDAFGPASRRRAFTRWSRDRRESCRSRPGSTPPTATSPGLALEASGLSPWVHHFASNGAPSKSTR